MFDKRLFSARIAQVRRQKSALIGRALTQAEVAAGADVSRSHVGASETGHHGVSLEVAVKLAEFYDASLDYLTGLSASNFDPDSSTKVAKSAQEIEWLGAWRDMNDAQRRRAIALIKAMILADSDAA